MHTFVNLFIVYPIIASSNPTLIDNDGQLSLLNSL